MQKSTTILFLAVAMGCFSGYATLFAQTKPRTMQQQMDSTTLNMSMETAQSDAKDLKRLIENLNSFPPQSRPALLKRIVAKSNRLVGSVNTLQTGISKAGPVRRRDADNASVSQSAASLIALVEEMQGGLRAGSVEFAANCHKTEASNEAACSDCCRANYTDTQSFKDCLEYCRAKAALARAVKILKESTEEQAQNARTMGNN